MKYEYMKYMEAIRSHASYGYDELVADYLENPEEYVKSFNLFINGKSRKITTYRKDSNGARLRNYHKLFSKFITALYEPDEHSYAYRKEVSILDCVNMHLQNTCYLKTDIHSFFDSIEFDLLYNQIIKRVYKRFPGKKQLASYLKACFYEGHLPIGFVTSPVLSDLYLCEFDAEIASEFPDWTYTRYADDMIVSTAYPSAYEQRKSLKDSLEKALAERHLELNSKKSYFRELKSPGDAIKFLGLCMVKGENGQNRITVSDGFVRETSKEYCEFVERRESMDEEEIEESFAKVYGKIDFIRRCSPSSSIKLMKMLKVKLNMPIESLDRKYLMKLRKSL